MKLTITELLLPIFAIRVMARDNASIRFCCLWKNSCSDNDTIQLGKVKGVHGAENISSDVRIFRGNPCKLRFKVSFDKGTWGFEAASWNFLKQFHVHCWCILFGLEWISMEKGRHRPLQQKSAPSVHHIRGQTVLQRWRILHSKLWRSALLATVWSRRFAVYQIRFDMWVRHVMVALPGRLFADLLITLAFLIITFLVYASFEDLRTRQDKCIVGYTATLSIYGCLALSTSTFWKPRDVDCTVVYYIFMVLSYSKDLWINAMSFDIWRALRYTDDDL